MTQQRHASVVTCPDCAVSKGISDPNEAVAFYRRHRSITGHDPEWDRADFPALESVRSNDLTTVIGGLESRYSDGVPIGLVTAAMSDRHATIGETLEAIYDLRMRGELYEPLDDHLRVT